MQLFIQSNDHNSTGYMSTENGYRLKKVGKDPSAPLHGTDAVAFSVDFTSKSNIPFDEITDGIIHYYDVDGEEHTF